MFTWYEVHFFRTIYTDDGAKKEWAAFKVLCASASGAMIQTRSYLHESVWEFDRIQEVSEDE